MFDPHLTRRRMGGRQRPFAGGDPQWAEAEYDGAFAFTDGSLLEGRFRGLCPLRGVLTAAPAQKGGGGAQECGGAQGAGGGGGGVVGGGGGAQEGGGSGGRRRWRVTYAGDAWLDPGLEPVTRVEVRV